MASTRTKPIFAMRDPSREWEWSTRSKRRSFYGGEKARALVEDPALGFYQALIEARIPFEMVHDRLLDREHIAQFRTLILPNIAALSDSAMSADS